MVALTPPIVAVDKLLELMLPEGIATMMRRDVNAGPKLTPVCVNVLEPLPVPDAVATYTSVTMPAAAAAFGNHSCVPPLMLNGPLNSILVLNNLSHAAGTVAIDLDAAFARLLWRSGLGLRGGLGLGNLALVGEFLLAEGMLAVQIGGVAALLEGELVL